MQIICSNPTSCTPGADDQYSASETSRIHQEMSAVYYILQCAPRDRFSETAAWDPLSRGKGTQGTKYSIIDEG